jgi:hypothetical protein
MICLLRRDPIVILDSHLYDKRDNAAADTDKKFFDHGSFPGMR